MTSYYSDNPGIIPLPWIDAGVINCTLLETLLELVRFFCSNNPKRLAIYELSLMGIEGAAVATILGQFVSFLMCAAYLFHSKNFKVTIKSFIPQGKLLGNIMALGASSFLTQLSIVVITIINNILLVEYGALSPTVS